MTTLNTNDFTELLDYSRVLQQHYYSCRLEKPTNTQTNDCLKWKCAKFTNLADANKFSTENSEQTVLSKIVPFSCGNPFGIFEENIIYRKLNYPIDIVKTETKTTDK